ncbi:methylmalonyl-CoA mutase [Bacillus sp. SORGH_AS 510]|uniref:methylmalonyl-CoA mutase subunit beta n=1 Tax=Bacillus sp. SORGH_AS_0510 TaxID=3041771 RepID=UPI002788F7FA|nr:methylmalonyl-CoA mutase subunit beta [Bacillus sp. SORGH_AS_0510]MDQ1145141.1 methylmalonyl-CoA mutase [Bacillus sp. SORGH_AS_0510]
MENIKSQSFPLKSTQEWKGKAEQSLKGKTIESLQTVTYENIVLKPLYSEEDEREISEFPGGSDFRRGINPLGYITNDWKIAQRIYYHTFEELQEKLLQSLERGQSAISFEVTKNLLEDDQMLEKILREFYQKYPFSLNAKVLHTEFLAALDRMAEQKEKSSSLSGFIGSDPVSLFAKEGKISEEYLNHWITSIVQTSGKFPSLRTVLIDTTPYHNGGASAVQELGIAIAEGTFYLDRFQDAGMDLEGILSKMVFQFSIGSNFFMEIAKLRAARVLWNRVAEVYGAGEDHRGMQISAETSTFTKTVYDPHVNLLRSGNEAFAAVMGGVQYLHVDPFNALTGSSLFSERIARNTQLLLKEEAHLKHVIDPSGGSWYIEQLTNELAQNAWEFFQRIEANGGILEGLKSGLLQKEIASVYDDKNKDVHTRKQSIVGTNVYANLDETVPDASIEIQESYQIDKKDQFIKIKAIQQRRLAEPFESLRNKAWKYEESTGNRPSVGLICLGEIKEHKTRLDFMKGFLAAGGIKADDSNPIADLETARQFISHLPAVKCFCICGTNEQYEEVGHDILNSLKEEFPNRTFYLAGLPEKETQQQWVAEGIQQFIHIKSNCYETLEAIFKELEVGKIEETKA